MQMYGLHSPITYYHFCCSFFRKIIIFILSLFNQVLGSHSPCRCWIFKFLFSFSSIWIFHGISHLLYYHSPSRLSVLTLHADVWFALSKQMFAFFNNKCLWHLHSKYITEKYISSDFFIKTVMIVVNNRRIT